MKPIPSNVSLSKLFLSSLSLPTYLSQLSSSNPYRTYLLSNLYRIISVQLTFIKPICTKVLCIALVPIIRLTLFQQILSTLSSLPLSNLSLPNGKMKGAQNLFWMMTGHHRFPKNPKEEHVFSNQEAEYSWGSKGVKGCQRLSVDNHDGAASFSEANQRKDKGRKLKREMNGDNSEAAETSS